MDDFFTFYYWVEYGTMDIVLSNIYDGKWIYEFMPSCTYMWHDGLEWHVHLGDNIRVAETKKLLAECGNIRYA